MHEGVASPALRQCAPRRQFRHAHTWFVRCGDARVSGLCGAAQCRACTVHVNGVPVFSCQTPISAVGDQPVTTIEGIGKVRLHVLQEAWIAEDVAQCGWCQPGQIMSAAALLASKPNPTDDDIDAAMGGNICRCGTYGRIRRAIHRAAGGGK